MPPLENGRAVMISESWAVPNLRPHYSTEQSREFLGGRGQSMHLFIDPLQDPKLPTPIALIYGTPEDTRQCLNQNVPKSERA